MAVGERHAFADGCSYVETLCGPMMPAVCRHCGAFALSTGEFGSPRWADVLCGACARRAAGLVGHPAWWGRRPPGRRGPGAAGIKGIAPFDDFAAVVVPAVPSVLVSSTLDVPVGAMPVSLPSLRARLVESGWRTAVSYSRAVEPATYYAASNKSGKAGQVKRAPRDVDAVILRFGYRWDAGHREVRGYTGWRGGRWDGGAAIVNDLDSGWGYLTFDTLTALTLWLAGF